MRALIASALLLLLPGCESSREKDCKDLLPHVDAAHDNPNAENVARLRAFTPRTTDLSAPVAAYAKAVDRLVAASNAQRDLVLALKMKSDAGAAFKLEMFEASRPHAEHLYTRCMVGNPPPVCAALSQALDACITPAKDDATAEEQLLSCANGFAAVKAVDKETNDSIQALAVTIRNIEPFARNVGAPAKDVIRSAKELLPKITDGQKAKVEANKAEMQIREICYPGPR